MVEHRGIETQPRRSPSLQPLAFKWSFGRSNLTFVENDGKKVGQCVCHCGQAEMNECKAPDVKLESWAEKSGEGEWFHMHVASICVDSGDDEFHFAAVEKAPALFGMGVRERYNEYVAEDGNRTSDGPLLG